MPHCVRCEREVKQPSEKLLRKALQAKAAGKAVHWDCPFCKSKDSVVGVIVPPGTDPPPTKPGQSTVSSIHLYEPGRDFFHV